MAGVDPLLAPSRRFEAYAPVVLCAGGGVLGPVPFS